MNDFILSYLPLFNIMLINAIPAYSQYIVLRAGTESFATAGFASIGAYAAAIAAIRYGLSPALGIALAGLLGGLAGAALSLPLARLRGVFQAIATIAFVQIIASLALYADHLTGGALGMNGIPKVIGTPHILVVVVLTMVLLTLINRSSIGRAFDAIRQDETVAVSLGVSVMFYQSFAFMLSGVLAGIGGAMLAYYTYSIVPHQFGFPLLVTIVSAVFLGGRSSIFGPLVGVAVLAFLPEIARPLASQRMMVYGMILVVVIIYLPLGIVDTAIEKWRRFRSSKNHIRLGSDDEMVREGRV
jgi:branched-chain amino acid transport system permease protein